MRTYTTPPWLPVEPDPPGRTALVEHTCALLSAPQAMVSLVGDPGTGVTTVAGAVAARMSRRLPVCSLRLAGLDSLPRLFHAIGHALGAPFPRDQAAVCDALREAGPTLLVLDDADQAEIEIVVERLAAVALEARFLAAGREPVFPERIVRLPPLLGTEGDWLDPSLASESGPGPTAGNLVLRELCDDPHAADPWSMLDDLPDGADLLAAFPAGVPGQRPKGLPQALLLPSPAGQVIMRRCVAERLAERRQPGEHDLSLALLPRCGHLLRIAEQPALATPPHAADLVVLEFLAHHHPDPGEAARASAAWSRFVVAAGQASAARVWRQADARIPRGGRFEALLAWAEGDALLADGLVDEALVAFEFAARQLRRGGDVRQLAALHLRCAEQLQARSANEAAEEHAQSAAELYQAQGDLFGQAMVLRSLASVSIQGRRPDPARAQLDQAEALAERAGLDPLPAPLTITRMALALLEGDETLAEELLRRARVAPGADLLQRGCLERLHGELCMRRGEQDEAQHHLEQAAECFGRAGARAAVGITLRLLGDCAALGGQPRRSEEYYLRATREQVRAGALAGLTRTLEHRAALEREHGGAEVAERLDTLREELHKLLESG
jgi:tetratricopeptide (TPR) repeat protein